MAPQAAVNAFRNGELDAVDVDKKDLKARAGSRPGIDLRVSVRPVATYMVVNLDARAARPAGPAGPAGRDRPEDLGADPLHRPGLHRGTARLVPAAPFQPGYRDNVGSTITYDQGRARRLLDEAGWVGDGIRHRADRSDQRLVLNLPVVGEDAMRQTIARAIQSMLRQIGVDVVIKVRPDADLAAVVNHKEFDIFTLGFGWTDPFGVAYLCQFWCTNSPMNGAEPELLRSMHRSTVCSRSPNRPRRSWRQTTSRRRHSGSSPTCRSSTARR